MSPHGLALHCILASVRSSTLAARSADVSPKKQKTRPPVLPAGRVFQFRYLAALLDQLIGRNLSQAAEQLLQEGDALDIVVRHPARQGDDTAVFQSESFDI